MTPIQMTLITTLCVMFPIFIANYIFYKMKSKKPRYEPPVQEILDALEDLDRWEVEYERQGFADHTYKFKDKVIGHVFIVKRQDYIGNTTLTLNSGAFTNKEEEVLCNAMLELYFTKLAIVESNEQKKERDHIIDLYCDKQ